MQPDERLREVAAAWAVRVGDPAFADWGEFTAWLEESPHHTAAYDQVASAVATAAEGLAATTVVPANDDFVRPARVTRRWFGGALAASLAAILAFAVWPGDDRYTEETRPGEMRLIALEDGTRIELSGDTRVELDRDHPRFARLERGRALFTVRHDDSSPFRVEAGEDTLLDVGTVFEVALSGHGMSVAVAEGAVIFNPRRQAVRLDPGDLLRSAHGSAAYERFQLAPEQVGEWRKGRLSFHSATLAEVAAELSRASGIEFSAARGSDKRLSGSILIAPVREDPRMAAALLGVSVRPQGDGWVIDAP